MIRGHQAQQASIQGQDGQLILQRSRRFPHGDSLVREGTHRRALGVQDQDDVAAMRSDLAFEAVSFVARRSMDVVDRCEVVAWAEQKVTASEQEPLVLELAAVSSAEYDKVDDLVAALARSLGFGELSGYRAAMLSAAYVARRLGQGLTEPIEAARSIWHIAVEVPESVSDLRPFIGLASEWDDDPESRSYYEEQIRSCALALQNWARESDHGDP